MRSIFEVRRNSPITHPGTMEEVISIRSQLTQDIKKRARRSIMLRGRINVDELSYFPPINDPFLGESDVPLVMMEIIRYWHWPDHTTGFYIPNHPKSPMRGWSSTVISSLIGRMLVKNRIMSIQSSSLYTGCSREMSGHYAVVSIPRISKVKADELGTSHPIPYSKLGTYEYPKYVTHLSNELVYNLLHNLIEGDNQFNFYGTDDVISLPRMK